MKITPPTPEQQAFYHALKKTIEDTAANNPIRTGPMLAIIGQLCGYLIACDPELENGKEIIRDNLEFAFDLSRKLPEGAHLN